MVTSCCAVGCTNRQGQKPGVSFYRFPADEEKRDRWVTAVKRVVKRVREGDGAEEASTRPVLVSKWIPNEWSRICSEHFISGKKSNNPRAPNYVPTIFNHIPSPVKRKQEKALQTHERRERSKKQRTESLNRITAAEAMMDLSANPNIPARNSSSSHEEASLSHITAAEAMMDLSANLDVPARNSSSSHEEASVASQPESCLEERETIDPEKENIDPEVPGSHSCACGADGLKAEVKALNIECQSLREEVFSLRKKLESLSIDEDSFRKNDQKVKDLTGLPCFEILQAVLKLIGGHLKQGSSLSPFQQLLLTLMKLRFNLSMQFCAYQFGISRTTASRTFHDVIGVLDQRLVPISVIWPEREILRMSLPASFRRTFNKCACIIDCFEIFIDRASDLKARAQTYSNYKHHNTVKYLIGITPQGTISFISKGWGGRTSDKVVTLNCGFLNNLTPGDVILADRGFLVQEEIALQQCTLKMPAFTKKKDQLAALDVETSRALASQRIHVERVIGVTRQKYTMLQSTVHVSYLSTDEENYTKLDRIVRVACALTNLCESVVAFDE